jgi:hypothetical protein
MISLTFYIRHILFHVLNVAGIELRICLCPVGKPSGRDTSDHRKKRLGSLGNLDGNGISHDKMAVLTGTRQTGTWLRMSARTADGPTSM